ncbi:unnamed protein product [Urochloa humidicola]
MEPAVAWEPCELQLTNWAVEEPAAGFPVEYASIDIPDTGLQAYMPESGDGLEHLVEYYKYCSAASEHNPTSEKAMIFNSSYARRVVREVMADFKVHIDLTEYRMHLYPACLREVGKSYTVPRIVAIGPYHHGLDHLKPVEKVKHAAACYCVMQSGCLLEDLYGAVAQVADAVRWLYDKDVVERIGEDDFRHMMFFDACFLVQNMLMRSDRDKVNKSLLGFLCPYRIDIFHDVMLLENQIPWILVEIVIRFMRMPSIPKDFVRAKRYCMLPDDMEEPPQPKPLDWEEGNKPPHLLGLLRYYIVGKSKIKYPKSTPRNRSSSVSAIKLAEIGITLTANKTGEISDMDLNENLFAELSLPPLTLDRDRASYLVNMSAHELCTVESFREAEASDSAFSSYILLLAMLVYSEEDIHELRVRGILVGGGGLSNDDALQFFSRIQGLRYGQHYNYIIDTINSYRERWPMWNKIYAYFYNNWKTITAVIGAISTVAGIIGALA